MQDIAFQESCILIGGKVFVSYPKRCYFCKTYAKGLSHSSTKSTYESIGFFSKSSKPDFGPFLQLIGPSSPVETFFKKSDFFIYDCLTLCTKIKNWSASSEILLWEQTEPNSQKLPHRIQSFNIYVNQVFELGQTRFLYVRVLKHNAINVHEREV